MLANGKYRRGKRMASNTYTLTLDSDCGVPEYQEIEVEYGQSFSARRPTKYGYDFQGWAYRTSDGELNPVPVGSTYNFHKNMTFFAEWKGEQRIIRFDANGGTGGTTTVPRIYGQCLDVLPVASRTGYHFLGWFTKREGGTQIKPTTAVKDSTTYYAHWEILKYTVTFKNHSGDADPLLVRTVEYGGWIGSFPGTKTRLGYDFTGKWFIQGPGGEQVSEDYVVTEDLVIVPEWEEKTYAITYYTGGMGEVPSSFPTEYQISETPITPEDLEDVNGYRFIEWAPAEIPSEHIGDVTFIASWKIIDYEISFNPCTAEVHSPDTITRNHGDSIGRLPVLDERTGYDFKGWFTSQDGGQQISEETTVVCDAIYYAHWEAQKYTLHFDTCGGVSIPDDRNITYGQQIGAFPVDLSKYGYTFVGWYTDPIGGEEVESTDMIDTVGDRTVYAHWKNWTYTVRFNGSGNTSGTMPDQYFEYGVPKRLNQNLFKKRFTVTFNVNGGTAVEA